MLMQCLAEYSLSCGTISVKAVIDEHSFYKLKLGCNRIACNSFMHWKNTFLEIKEVTLDMKVPFSLSIERSFQEAGLTISIKEGHLNLIPTDFDHFFQLLVLDVG